MSCLVLSCLPCPVASRLPYLVLSRHSAPCRSSPRLPSRIESCRVASCHVCHVWPRQSQSSRVESRRVCLVKSRHVLFCHVSSAKPSQFFQVASRRVTSSLVCHVWPRQAGPLRVAPCLPCQVRTSRIGSCLATSAKLCRATSSRV